MLQQAGRYTSTNSTKLRNDMWYVYMYNVSDGGINRDVCERHMRRKKGAELTRAGNTGAEDLQFEHRIRSQVATTVTSRRFIFQIFTLAKSFVVNIKIINTVILNLFISNMKFLTYYQKAVSDFFTKWYLVTMTW